MGSVTGILGRDRKLGQVSIVVCICAAICTQEAGLGALYRLTLRIAKAALAENTEWC